jgi:hypothetical protein
VGTFQNLSVLPGHKKHTVIDIAKIMPSEYKLFIPPSHNALLLLWQTCDLLLTNRNMTGDGMSLP